ncbi:uncharacterized protein LOC129756148 [Uranotaenia lowii]|uniref:uncharacterized protein LOC129756148 n=1 Tax=Uranotaenia lowii TaxID=190385 RepID=UPI00247A199E|nr:uncharacterized protein LOC129756148 [Uranotaenia lowii]XP_055608916.1 uncharacterized protein LOC129756148 [Uranotaenia lowii]
MWKCHKCGKPVFFAERKQSLGYDWHPECLRCEECGKRLNPGQHAEHKGVPYCHVPCYGALFGPQLFGHGTRVESHKSFGQPELKKQAVLRSPASPAIPRPHLEAKIKAFNQFTNSKSQEIRSREVNGRLVLEGALRIYWGVQGIIHLKEDDDQRTVVTVRKRNSYRYSQPVSMTSALNQMDLEDKENLNPDRSDPMSSSLTEGGNDTTTISESISYDTLSISSDINSISSSKPNSGENSKETSPSHVANGGSSNNKYVTLPPKLDVKQLDWDEIDDLLQVERKVDENEKLYRTMPSPMTSQHDGQADQSEISESITETDYKTLTPQTVTNSSSTDSNKTTTATTLNGTDDDFRTPEGTLRSHDFEAFKMQMSQEFINGAADLGTTDGTLKLNQPIDPARINDSLKLYNDSVLNRSLSDEQCRHVFSLPQGNITDSFHVINDGTLKHPDNLSVSSPAKVPKKQNGETSGGSRTQIAYQRHQSDSVTSPGTDTDSWTGDRGLLRSKSQGNNYSGNSFMDSEDEEGTETLKPSDRPQTSIHIRMDCYDEPPLNGRGPVNGELLQSPINGTAGEILSPTTDESITTVSLTTTTATTTTEGEDGVVLRKPPKTGSTAIKRRSGNRRSRTKLKRRCSINGHFYNRETSFFTPPYGSQMNVWVTSLVNTQEVITLLLEKYKVESRAENFALFVIKDNGEQKKLKEDDYPLVNRVILGPHEDIAKLFLMDGQQTPEISSEVAQFLNLSIPECRAILERYHEEEQRELFRIRSKYAELRRRIIQRMESLKVRL